MLEERFPERVASEPEVVARHYDQAGLAAQAIAHYQRAGERATQRSANEEAIGHLRRALALVATLPETRERHQMELGLQMAIGAPLAAARGWSHPEYEQTYARARELASQIGESPELPRVLAGMAAAYFVKGDLATAAEVAQEALAAAERTGDAFDLLSAHYSSRPCRCSSRATSRGRCSISSRASNYTIPARMGLWRTRWDSIVASTPTRMRPGVTCTLAIPTGRWR